jgi:hypothetical protein
MKKIWVWWCGFVIPAIQEVGAGGLWGHSEQHSDTLSQKAKQNKNLIWDYFAHNEWEKYWNPDFFKILLFSNIL